MQPKALVLRVVIAGLTGMVLGALALSALAVWLIVSEPVALASALHTRDIQPVVRVLMR